MKLTLTKKGQSNVKQGQFGAYTQTNWKFMFNGVEVMGSVIENDETVNWRDGDTVEVKEVQKNEVNGKTYHNIKMFTKKEKELMRAIAPQQIASTPALVHSEGSNMVAIANIETSLAKLEQEQRRMNYILKQIKDALNIQDDPYIKDESIPF